MTASGPAALRPEATEERATSFQTGPRRPRQDRSKASLKRMLSAARSLMIERGNEDFTLIEVSKCGNVSIGSIYLRFSNKDNLVRAVIAEAMAGMRRDETVMFERLGESCQTLREFVPQFVTAYAGLLTRHAALLRLAMMRAEHDPLIAEPGKKAALRVLKQAQDAMLRYGDELGSEGRGTRTSTAFYVIFATLARQLRLGSSQESVSDFDWEQLKRELGSMCLAYLTAD